jgi:hypothetical protein
MDGLKPLNRRSDEYIMGDQSLASTKAGHS